MSTTAMVSGGSYDDAQGTHYVVAGTVGDLTIAVFGRKFWTIVAADARMNDGLFQFRLVGTNLWLQITFAPLSSKIVPA